MKTNLKLHLPASVLCLLTSTLCLPAFAQGTGFTYQGRLNDGASPASGIYDLRFTIYESTNNPGVVIAGPLTNSATGVSNGLFTVTLDFGGGVFTGPARWLEIGVRTNGAGAFTTLAPRQQLTPTPYAIHAGGTSNLLGTVGANGLAGTYAGAVTFSNAANSFAGSGAGLTGLNASQLTGGTVPTLALSNAWKIGGNAGTTAGADFIGTTDNQPLEFKVNGARALRLEDNGDSASDSGTVPDGAPNVIGGSVRNFVAAGVTGAFIGGGGATNFGGAGGALTNSVASDFGVVGGGQANRIQSDARASTIAGGGFNEIGDGASYSAISGGSFNSIATNSDFSAIGGGQLNRISVNSLYATIAGGSDHNIDAGSSYTMIGGGHDNNIAASSSYATIAGGLVNDIGTNAAGSAIGGGSDNNIADNSAYATIPGGQLNVATSYAFAAGNRAKANHQGAFVWADSTAADFASITNNEFAVRAAGGVRFVTSSGGVTLNNQPLLTSSSANAVNLTNAANVFSGAFSGNGSGLTNLSAATLGGLNASNFWRTAGNAGTTPSVNFLGTTDNQPLEFKVNGVRALRLEFGGDSAEDPDSAADGAPNVILGAPVNFVAAGVVGATIAGGGATNYNTTVRINSILSSYGAIGGGMNNRIAPGANRSAIAGGNNNDIGTNSSFSVIGGGDNNNIATDSPYTSIVGGTRNDVGTNSSYSVLGGGTNNNIAANSAGSTIAGGHGNDIDTFSDGATIGGGHLNNIGANSPNSAIGGGFSNNIAANSPYATIAGGYLNDIGTNSDSSAIGGGYDNDIADNSFAATIAGGFANDIGTDSDDSAIGGGNNNTIADYSFDATIAGGLFNSIGTNSHYSGIAGGYYNNIADNSTCATVAGGDGNGISTNSDFSAIGGGYVNNIGANSVYASIAGGYSNDIGTNSDESAIGGGHNNNIADNSQFATIAGGYSNDIGTNSLSTAIGGGNGNTIADNSFGATVAGGLFNSIGTDSDDGAIGGGANNIIADNSSFATIPGGESNFATNYAFAAGYHAKANDTGAFVWGDSSSADIFSTTKNSVTFRASGGYRLFSNPSSTIGVSLPASGNSWAAISDRNRKKDIQPLDGGQVLAKLAAVPISTWHYDFESSTETPHIGPMAQDFKAAFYPGRDDKTISTMEFDGVALAAIQGLNEKVEARSQKTEVRSQRSEDRLQKLEAENAELKQRLATLEKIILNRTPN